MSSCVCSKCVNACKRAPGLFAPGEAEKAAELLGVPFEKFKKRLVRTYHWLPEDPLIWRPRREGADPDEEIESDRTTNTPGRCVFLIAQDRCEIHEAKPYECRHSMLCEGSKDYWPEIKALWREQSNAIKKEEKK